MDYAGLRERQVLYAVSVPGETEWYKRSQDASSSSNVDALASSVHGLNVSSTSATAVLPHKYPIPEEPHAGALIKLYPFSNGKASLTEDQPFKATEVVDFVGILDYTTFPSSSLGQDDQPVDAMAGNAIQPNELVKTLHVVMTITSSQGQQGVISAPSSPGRPTPVQSPVETRDELISHLAHSLEGDKLAAEWLLLSLLGKM